MHITRFFSSQYLYKLVSQSLFWYSTQLTKQSLRGITPFKTEHYWTISPGNHNHGATLQLSLEELSPSRSLSTGAHMTITLPDKLFWPTCPLLSRVYQCHENKNGNFKNQKPLVDAQLENTRLSWRGQWHPAALFHECLGLLQHQPPLHGAQPLTKLHWEPF